MPRVFVAGASGVIGARVVRLLVAAGHTVGAMTRSASKSDALARLGAEPIVVDVFDLRALTEAVVSFRPDIILNELTDLPDDASRIAEHAALNARMRVEGNGNLILAARECGLPRILVQSVAWQLAEGPGPRAVAELERAVLAEGGVVMRYGQFYGPGTYYEETVPREPRVHIDHAAQRTVKLLDSPSGIVVITDR